MPNSTQLPLTYAGIGGRPQSLPEHAQALLSSLGLHLAEKGCTLHTGACEGADQWFCSGALTAGGSVVLHIPWKKYAKEYIETLPPSVEVSILQSNKKTRDLEAFDSVKLYHPTPENLTWGARCHHAINYRTLVPDRPVDFVLAYPSPHGGGTMQGVHVAQDKGIPVVRLDQLQPRQVWSAVESILDE